MKKTIWERLDVRGCNNRIWIKGESGALYVSTTDPNLFMWRNNIIGAPNVEEAILLLRFLEVEPVKKLRMCLIGVYGKSCR